MNAPIIILDNVGKRYPLCKNRDDTLRDRLAHWLRLPINSSVIDPGLSDSSQGFWALRNISAHIHPGECVGIIGHNGAGKSTLLKLLSRITSPSEGTIRLRGSLASLLEVGVGFHPDLTGRENVYLAGALLRMSKREIERSLPQIHDFSELADAFDRPVRTYSTGMYMRLGFSVAVHLRCDIVLLDEVLAVGDLRFQQKCSRFLDDLRRRKTTILMVSHNLFLIKSLCSRVLYLKQGRLVYDGHPSVGIARYEADSYLQIPDWALSVASPQHQGSYHVLDIVTTDSSGTPTKFFHHGSTMVVHIRLRCKANPRLANIVIGVLRHDGLPCCAYSSTLDGFTLPENDCELIVRATIPCIRWVADSYRIDILIWDRDFQRLYTAAKGPTIAVAHHLLSREFGVFHESAQWECIQSISSNDHCVPSAN